MCGIAVAIDWPDAELTVRLLISGILHRGDVTDPVVTPRQDSALATRRLRIVDAEHAVQPQISFNGRLAVSFNGEIYNYLELRRELTDLGVEFRTESDTEVLANALQAWGYRALERLDRHVCLCGARYGERGIPRRARPVRRQAALRHPIQAAAFCSARR